MSRRAIPKANPAVRSIRGGAVHAPQPCDQSDFAAVLFAPDEPCPAGLVTWNGSDPTPRMAVYQNNVMSSLVDALAETFPVVQELVGTEFFRAMAAVFVRLHPPRSRVLAHYGSTFPDFIASFEPAQSVPYLCDVARLEVARVRAYHAADADPVTNEAVGLAMASGDQMAGLRLVCHPSVQITQSSFAVVSLWAAHQGEGDLATVDPFRAEAALTLRENLEVLVMRLPAGAAQFVLSIQANHCLGDSASAALDACPAFELSTTLALLLGHGAVTSIHLPRRLDS